MLKKIFHFVVLIIIILLILVMPLIFNKMIDILICLKWISSNQDNAMLSFYSTLLGGTVTIIGVWFTIKSERKLSNEQDLIKYKPILDVFGINVNENCALREVALSMPYSSPNNVENREKSYEDFRSKITPTVPTYRIVIQNKGRGETFDMVLNNFKFKETNWDKESNLYSSYSGNQYVGELLSDGYFGINIYLPEYLFMPEKMEHVLWYELRAELNMSYSDMFDRMKYQYNLHLVFKVEIVKFEEEQPYLYKDGFKFAKVKYDLDQILPSKKVYSKKHNDYVHELYSLRPMKQKSLFKDWKKKIKGKI